MNRSDLIASILSYLNSVQSGLVDPRIFDSWSDEELRRFAPAEHPVRGFSCEAEPLANGCAIIRISGSFEDNDGDAFLKGVYRLLDENCFTLILDCGYLYDCSTTGIACIVHALRLTKEHNGTIILSGIRDKVQQRFEKLGFLPFFTIDTKSPRQEVPGEGDEFARIRHQVELENLRRIDDENLTLFRKDPKRPLTPPPPKEREADSS